MAQKQFNNYQDNILSFDLREAMLGVIKPGRYCGYDTITHNSTGGGVINIYINHTTGGIQKASNAIPPVLGSRTGVVFTTQGLLIHDDTTNIPIAIDQSASTGDRYDIIYCQHWFINGTPGANPATYGIKKGTAGAGVPALDSPSKQVPLILVTIPNTVVTYAGLIFTPYQSELGDLSILASIGTRLYAENNYITDSESLTASIDKLDIQLKDELDARVLIGNRPLDSASWGALTDITTQDASTARHGLLKKLSNVANQFLNGQGNWAVPSGGKIVMRTGSYSVDVTLTSASPNGNDIDFSSIAPSDADAFLVKWRLESLSTLPSGYYVNFYAKSASGDAHEEAFGEVFNSQAAAGVQWRNHGQFWVKATAGRHCYIQIPTLTYLSSLQLTLVGWQTYL